MNDDTAEHEDETQDGTHIANSGGVAKDTSMAIASNIATVALAMLASIQRLSRLSRLLRLGGRTNYVMSPGRSWRMRRRTPCRYTKIIKEQKPITI